MSLLLDALKRAAEQKAAKTREDESGSAGAADSSVDLASRAAPSADDGDDSSIPHHRLEDETELDPSELSVRLGRLRGGLDDGTETGLEVPVDADSTLLPPTGRSGGGEDETFIFSADDAAEVISDDPVPPRAAEDETDLSQLLAEGEASVAAKDAAADAGPAYAEDTDLRQPASPDDRASPEALPLRGEETDLSLPSASPEMRDSQPDGGQPQPADDTNLSALQAGDDSGAADEDMSLLLVEREPTQLTDPRTPQEALLALQAEAPTAEELGLVDTTRNRFDAGRESSGDITLTRASNTATTGIATATANLSGVPRPDPSATQTYAPDNYDRTLMRLPNDDASKLFAGMKSDGDVVMTPDYAKRVFRSKSSALRFQHYKVYSGVAVAILLGIAVYGILEFQSESDIIDADLLPLMQDPLPGTNQSAIAEPSAETPLAESEVNKRTLEILQSAGDLGEPAVTDEAAAGETLPEPQADNVTETAGGASSGADPDMSGLPPEVAVTETEPPAASASGAAKTATDNPPRPAGTPKISEPIAMSEPAGKAADQKVRVASAAASPPTAVSASGAGSNLQIETRERLEEKQVLLREAYAAYQAGDDRLALELYNRVLKMDPGNRNALLARAAIYVHNDNSGAAIEDYQSLLLANPKDSLAMASLLAVANYSPLDTETQLKLMIRDEPDSPHLNFALANAYAAQNRWQEAQGHYFRALQNNPDDPNYAYNLAVSLEHISQPVAAISYYRRALENYNKGLATFSRDAVDRRLEKLAKS